MRVQISLGAPFTLIAQLAEYITFNHGIVGSNPTLDIADRTHGQVARLITYEERVRLPHPPLGFTPCVTVHKKKAGFANFARKFAVVQCSLLVP